MFPPVYIIVVSMKVSRDVSNAVNRFPRNTGMPNYDNYSLQSIEYDANIVVPNNIRLQVLVPVLRNHNK